MSVYQADIFQTLNTGTVRNSCLNASNVWPIWSFFTRTKNWLPFIHFLLKILSVFFFCVRVCVVQQHQLQLVSLQQHKKQLEKHKKELEDMSMWPLFPKTVYKPGNVWSAPPSAPAFQPTTAPLTSTSAPINLAQHKKQAAGAKKIERASGGPVSQPIQQHLMQVGLVDCC